MSTKDHPETDKLIKGCEREIRILQSRLDRCQANRKRLEDMYDGQTRILRTAIEEEEAATAARDRLLTRFHRAQEDERRRIANELHDVFGQHFAATRNYAALIRKSIERDDEASLAKAYEYAGKIQALAEELTATSRNLLRTMWPDAIEQYGLGAALREHIHLWKEHTPDTNFDLRIDDVPPLEAPILVFRVAQEALTNIDRYARADEVTVTLRETAQSDRDGIGLTIEDNGTGFSMEGDDARRAGHGILGMRERARTVDGEVTIESAPGRGTRVHLWVPLNSPETERADARSDA